MNKFLSIFLFFLFTISFIGVVVAETNNTQTIDTNDINNVDEKNFVNQINEEKITSAPSEIINGDCSTTVIQGENNDSAVSFRRDGTEKNTIYVKHNNTFVKQFKTGDSYYFHILINKNGWIIGNGGIETASATRIIEDVSLKMIQDNSISNKYLGKIYKIKSKSISHYIIKSPNGTYNLIIIVFYHKFMSKNSINQFS